MVVNLDATVDAIKKAQEEAELMSRVLDLKNEINEPSRSFFNGREKHRHCVRWHSLNRMSTRREEIINDGRIL